MPAIVLPFSVNRRGPKKWTTAEISECYRIVDLLQRAGLPITLESGFSDEDEPWLAFVRDDTQDVIAHLAIIDDQVIAASAGSDAVFRGRNLRDVLAQVLRTQPIIMPASIEDGSGSRIFLHPATILAAFLATAFVHAAHADPFVGDHPRLAFESVGKGSTDIDDRFSPEDDSLVVSHLNLSAVDRRDGGPGADRLDGSQQNQSHIYTQVAMAVAVVIAINASNQDSVTRIDESVYSVPADIAAVRISEHPVVVQADLATVQDPATDGSAIVLDLLLERSAGFPSRSEPAELAKAENEALRFDPDSIRLGHYPDDLSDGISTASVHVDPVVLMTVTNPQNTPRDIAPHEVDLHSPLQVDAVLNFAIVQPVAPSFNHAQKLPASFANNEVINIAWGEFYRAGAALLGFLSATGGLAQGVEVGRNADATTPVDPTASATHPASMSEIAVRISTPKNTSISPATPAAPAAAPAPSSSTSTSAPSATSPPLADPSGTVHSGLEGAKAVLLFTWSDIALLNATTWERTLVKAFLSMSQVEGYVDRVLVYESNTVTTPATMLMPGVAVVHEDNVPSTMFSRSMITPLNLDLGHGAIIKLVGVVDI